MKRVSLVIMAFALIVSSWFMLGEDVQAKGSSKSSGKTVTVNGYYRNGTYVHSYTRSAPSSHSSSSSSYTSSTYTPPPTSSTSSSNSVYVHGYYRSDGTYVAGYYRSAPDSSVTNNWSYCGNTNPYTGEVGTVGCGTNPSATPNLTGATTSAGTNIPTYTPTYTGSTNTNYSNVGSTTSSTVPSKVQPEVAGTVECITIGSSREDVKRILGNPTSEGRLYYAYGYSMINFDYNTGLVDGWSNIGDTQLPVYLGDAVQYSPFTLGSSKEDVVKAMGTPDSVSKTFFTYGNSMVNFDYSTEKVTGWTTIETPLNVVFGNKVANASPFSQGSSLQEVLNVMGTPSSLTHSAYSWILSYGNSSVYLSGDGKVTSYYDLGKILKVK
ncbi:hypothetical protein ACFPOG_12255 [Paenibacillus aestuarii]|uniref:DUF4309 domain-containing protein n=1 Tax=Paenibacillus aestuarii TaxID=516965 RepID=A0ABW0K6U6_9BACL